MPEKSESESRKLLKKLKETLSEESAGQERLDKITNIIAASMKTHVCSVYLLRDEKTLELCATQGLKKSAIHQTRLKIGEGLVGKVAKSIESINTENAPSEKGFRFMPETGEGIYSSFLGVPIQRLGKTLGVLVVQTKHSRSYTEDEVYGLEVVAMVLAEMTELGAFIGDGEALSPLHTKPVTFNGEINHEGVADGAVYLHEPRVVITNPIAEDPHEEVRRLDESINVLRTSVDRLLESADSIIESDQKKILDTYRMFANSRGWVRKMKENIALGLSAEAAVEKEQSLTRARMEKVPDAYLKDRLHDLDDLSNRLLRILTGQGKETGAIVPKNPILVARNIGPGELLDYGKSLKAIVLEEGSIGSHASIIARAWNIPLVIFAKNILIEALNGDPILVDGDLGIAHLRPDETIVKAFKDKILMQKEAQKKYASIRTLKARSLCKTVIQMNMNAGLLGELPSLEKSGADGIGLFRTELQFLTRSKFPKRAELATMYSSVLDAAKGKNIIFRTLDIGADKILPFMKVQAELNPSLGWRGIRQSLDKKIVTKIQLQALIRGSNGRDLSIMFPMISEFSEFSEARELVLAQLSKEKKSGKILPKHIKIGAMLEIPSLAYTSEKFFDQVDFISIGGNDLKQFFFAADRDNELVRNRYDTLNTSFITFLKKIIRRCENSKTPLSFCGEDAGRPIEAICLAAIGIRSLSMRAPSIGPVKSLLRKVNLNDIKTVINTSIKDGESSVRQAVTDHLNGI